MADKISVRFTGDSQDLENKISKLEGKYRDLQQRVRETGKAHEDAAGGADKMAAAITGKVTGIVTGYLSVAKAVGVIIQAHENWDQKMRQSANQAEQLFQKYRTEMFQAGGFQNLRGWVESVVRDKEVMGTRAELLSAVSGARVAMPGFSATQNRDVAMQAMYAAPSLGNEQNIRQWAGVIGSFRRAGVGGTAAESAEYAFAAQQQRIGAITDSQFAANVQALVQSGLATPAQAIGLAAEMEKAGVSGEGFGMLVGKLTKGPPQSVSTPQDAALRRIYSLPVGERLRGALTDRRALQGLVEAQQWGRMQQVQWTPIEQTAAQIEASVSGGGYLRSMQQQDPRDLYEAMMRRREDLSAMRREPSALRLADERQMLEAAWEARGTPEVARSLYRGIGWAHEFLGFGETRRDRENRPLPPIVVQLSPEDRARLDTASATSAAQNAKAAAGER